MRRTLPAWAAPAFLLAAGVFILGPHAAHTGLHVDDHGFHLALARADWPRVRHEFLSYVPGRNLHILYYAGLYRLLGPDPARLHLFGLAVDLLNALLAWALLRQLSLPPRWALVGAGLFLVYPNHGETHFWTVLIAQCLIPTALTLAAFLCAGADAPAVPRLTGALLLYALAVFDYDQMFFMWLPLLAHARLARRPASYSAVAGAAGVCLAMNVVHVLLRVYGPVASGGRPTIRLANVLSSGWDAAQSAFAPMRKLPAWESLHGWAGGPVAAVLACAAVAAAWTALCAALPERGGGARWRQRAALMGTAWLVCGYLPNLFWYVSARHGYLPSLGVALLACSALAGAPGPALAAAGWLAFGLSSAAALGEGYAWRRAAELHESFRAAAPRLAPPPVGSLFVLGAPQRVLRAPAFEHPQEACALYAEAAGGEPPRGDLSLSAGRTGAFYGNEVDLFGRESLRWAPYADMRVLGYDAGRWSCAGALRVDAADGSVWERPLPAAAGCVGSRRVPAEGWLVSATAARADRAPALDAAPNGAALLGVDAERSPSLLTLRLSWRAERRLADFAAVPVLRDAAGRVVFDAAYPIEGRPGHSALWPVYDELRPPSRWPAGGGAREVYVYRLARPLPDGPLTAELSLFEKGDGAWTPLATLRAPVGPAR